MTLAYAELFAGAGGLSLGLETAGWEPVAHAEIEPHARAVLRHHWPTVRLDGDVSQLNGADYAGVTLLSGGSPCQDLSIAGKRAGMTEGSGTRSSLFFDQFRIWQESQAPYFLWENVLGALSSNDGRDFAAVLSALVGAAVPVPAHGWESAGVAAGPTGVAAWRVLDCQFFGPPQRRRRVFVLGARAGGVDPAEVLALAEGVRRDSPARGEAGQATASDAGGGAGRAGIFNWQVAGKHGAVNLKDRADSLHVGQTPAVLAVNVSDGAGRLDAVMGTLGARSGTRRAGVIAFRTDQEPEAASGDVCHTLDSGSKSGGGQTPAVLQVVFTVDKHSGAAGDVAPTLKTDLAHQMGPVVAMASGQANAEIVSEGSPSLTAQHDGPPIAFQGVGIPRRLMPVECERLMGWPDAWTKVGVLSRIEAEAALETAKFDAVDARRADETTGDCESRKLEAARAVKRWKKILKRVGAAETVRYELSDTARYRLCGNGVASPVAAWIGWRLREAILTSTAALGRAA